MKKKLSITINGKTFTRITERTYTHVLVGRQNEAKARDYAFGWSAAEEKNHLEYLAHLAERANKSWWPKNGFEFEDYDVAGWERDVATLALGSDELRERAKTRKIEEFQGTEARGLFADHVVSWHGSEKAARAALTTAQNRGFLVGLRVEKI